MLHRHFAFWRKMPEMDLTKLTRQHGLKIIPNDPTMTVEECSLAVGEVVGCCSIKSAARMNSAVVIFVDSVEKANKVIEKGIVVNDVFLSVSPLSTPAKKVTIANIPPFISDELLVRELSRHGKIISAIRKMPSGCKSPQLKHVVSHRRQVLMILNKKNEDLNLVLNVRVDEFDYAIYVNSGTVVCFGCGEVGHLVRMCPGKKPSSVNSAQTQNKENENLIGQAEVPDSRSAVTIETEGQTSETSKNVQNEKEVQKLSVVENGEQISKNQTVNVSQERQEDNSEEGQSQSLLEAFQRKTDIEEIEDEGCSQTPEEDVLKFSQKRKFSESIIGSQIDNDEEDTELECSGKVPESESIMDEEEEGEDEGWTEDSLASSCNSIVQSQKRKGYGVLNVKNFLKITKNMKNVKVEDFFPDKKLFFTHVRSQLNNKRKGGYNDKEVYRLKKLIGKLKQEFNDDELEV